MPKYTELDGDKKAIEAHFDALFTIYKELRDYLANILFCLPRYTQQSFQKEVEALHDTLNAEKDKAVPKSKFAFKMNKKLKKPKEEKKEIEDIEEEDADQDVDIFCYD